MAQQLANGETPALPGTGSDDMAPHEHLIRLARDRAKAGYQRNLPKVCTFWLNGECERGAACPYRHEQPPQGHEAGGSVQKSIQERYEGKEDPHAKALLAKAKAEYDDFPQPPQDQAITTLWLGEVPERTTDMDIREQCYQYGEVKSIKVVPAKKCAFVEFRTRKQAETAVKGLYQKMKIKGTPITVKWSYVPQANTDWQGAPIAAPF
ncbi:rbm22, partial [Symbiodinium sp. KB8]